MQCAMFGAPRSDPELVGAVCGKLVCNEDEDRMASSSTGKLKWLSSLRREGVSGER